MSRVGLSYNLRSLRGLYGYTQEAISTYLNIERQTYNHYETGKRTPSLEIIIELANFYQVTADELICLHAVDSIAEDSAYYNSVKSDNSKYTMTLTQNEAAFIQDMRVLPLPVRQEIFDFTAFKKSLLKKDIGK